MRRKDRVSLLRSLRRDKKRKERDAGGEIPVQGGRTTEIDPVGLLIGQARSWFERQRDPFRAAYHYDMGGVLKPRSGERFELRIEDVSPADALSNRLRGILTGQELNESFDTFPGRRIMLFDKLKGDPLMASGTWERRATLPGLVHARGRVLTAGLGLGMFLLEAQRKPEVEEITVVEIHQEVIDLVAPQLPLTEKARIVQGDFFEWEPPSGAAYDCIWCDIFCREVQRRTSLAQLEALRDRLQSFLAAGGWVGFWAEETIALEAYLAGRPWR